MEVKINITKAKNVIDASFRKSALETIEQNASTEALEALADLVKIKGADKKFVANKSMLKRFL